MKNGEDKRRHQRIRYSWPLWFGYSNEGEFYAGTVVDLCRNGISFTIPDNQAPSVGTHVKTRFSYPLNVEERFAMDDYYHWSEVIRVDSAKPGYHRVAMRFHQPLPVDPAIPCPAVSVDDPVAVPV